MSGRSASDTIRMTAMMMIASSSISRGDRPIIEPTRIQLITHHSSLFTLHSAFRTPHFLIRIISPQHNRNRLEHYLQIQPRRPVLYVEYVERHHLFEVEPIPSAHLPQSRYSRLNMEARPMPVLV